ncbi:MAG: hypothetical protein LC624_08165 [Halobacteriales archaeon]|nr:hypothetical protein [Halobacteriales archaeon]
MASPPAMFCEHRRLRTVCPECKLALQPVREPTHVDLPSGRAEALPRSAPGEEAEPGEQRARGPGKPLMPLRKRARKATRAEAEAAEAWWVNKR